MSISWEKEEEEEQVLYEIFCRLDLLQQQSKKKIKQACSIGGDIPPSIQRRFLELPRDEDRVLIAWLYHWLLQSPKHYTFYKAGLHCQFSLFIAGYFQHKKSFRDMSREDILSDYLNSLKRPAAIDTQIKGGLIPTSKGQWCFLSSSSGWLSLI